MNQSNIQPFDAPNDFLQMSKSKSKNENEFSCKFMMLSGKKKQLSKAKNSSIKKSKFKSSSGKKMSQKKKMTNILLSAFDDSHKE